MGEVTITISDETVAMIQSGFAFTRFNGNADVRARRAVAEDEFDRAVREAKKGRRDGANDI